jgi:DUF1707 SHOCT-like domain/Glyoxalase-like domain
MIRRSPWAPGSAESPVYAPAHPDRPIDQLAQRITVDVIEALNVQAALPGLVRTQPRQRRPLTAEELDERLELALTARTYGELARLVADLPAAGSVADPPAPRVKDVIRLVAALRSAGARPADVGQGDVSWAVLADPEGSEFCVLSPS